MIYLLWAEGITVRCCKCNWRNKHCDYWIVVTAGLASVICTRAVITKQCRNRTCHSWTTSVTIRAGTNTPSDEYDSYREYRVANTNMYSRIHFFSEAKLGNGLTVLVYACTMYSAEKFHFANLVYSIHCIVTSKIMCEWFAVFTRAFY